jgi:ubiquinol-cytochrome c reductase cytochrome b subunit
MTEDQIIRQILQGGGDMPAYGKSLSPSETTALVRFLTTLRGNDLAPAIDASRHISLSGKLPSTMPSCPARSHFPAAENGSDSQ